MDLSKRNTFKLWVGIFIFLALSLFLTFNRHSRSDAFNYHSEIWADKAGYYVYLPALFIYDFNPFLFPDSIDVKTGKGFKLEYSERKIITKYTCGTAILQAPFFGAANLLASWLGFESSGFSPVYHWSINIASVFYLAASMIFLRLFLLKYVEEKTVLLTLLSLFLATNLYYYSIDETGMSHIYSFFTFSVFLYWIKTTGFLSQNKFWHYFIFGLLCALIILIRPTNTIFLSAYLFLDLRNIDELASRLKRLFRPAHFAFILLAALLIFLPQLIYWKYTFGSYIVYSYGDEGFNWSYPMFVHTFFSPDNGLFLYTPFYLLIIIAMIYHVRLNLITGSYLLFLFVIISYVFSSWHHWNFGCSFGARSYVEYLALFSLPVALYFEKVKSSSNYLRHIIILLMILLVVFNLKIIYTYDYCYFGNGAWDWQLYFDLVTSKTK